MASSDVTALCEDAFLSIPDLSGGAVPFTGTGLASSDWNERVSARLCGDRHERICSSKYDFSCFTTPSTVNADPTIGFCTACGSRLRLRA